MPSVRDRAGRSRPKVRIALRGRGRSSARRGTGPDGRWTRPMATSSLRRMPPDQVDTRRSPASSRPNLARAALRPGRAARARGSRRRGPAGRGSPCRSPTDRPQTAGRQRRSRAAPARGGPATSWPATVARPRVRSGQGGENSDRRRLAGAVRSEQGEDAAAADVEAHAIERSHALRIGLDEVACLDGPCMIRAVHGSFLSILRREIITS